MAAHNDLGKWGEDIAAEYLQKKQFRIIQRDWRSGHRDIDIVATDGECLIFVEVKTRRDTEYGSPLDAINYWKRKNLLASINHYIRAHHIDMPFRCDVVAVVAHIGEEPDITHIEDINLLQD
ncbi:MAG: YraN family protein [Bacteroidaceae bacterium]|nr:YraN family protein [Bacteroidaceae bacterium]